MYTPELHLELQRGELAERARHPRWSPRQPQHPPGWRLALADGLRSAADRLASPQPVEAPAERRA